MSEMDKKEEGGLYGVYAVRCRKIGIARNKAEKR